MMYEFIQVIVCVIVTGTLTVIFERHFDMLPFIALSLPFITAISYLWNIDFTKTISLEFIIGIALFISITSRTAAVEAEQQTRKSGYK